MIVTHRINMDLARRGVLPTIDAVQDDKYSRNLEISLYSGCVAWKPPDGTSVLVAYLKSDRHGGEYDALPDGTLAYSISGNMVTVALAPQVLTTAGSVRVNVCLINGDEEISTFQIQINVHPNVGVQIAESEDYYKNTRLEAMVEQMQKDIADLQYEEIRFVSISNSLGIVEMNDSSHPVTIKWELNKDPVSQTMNGAAIEAGARNFAGDAVRGTVESFAVTATDERSAIATATTTVYFYNGVYYGELEDGAQLDSAAILSLTRKLQSGRALSFTADPGVAQRIAYALPARYGEPDFHVGGFEGGFYKAATLDFTNASGYTESYDVWLSDNTGLGDTTVKVS